ncbi:Multidrug efflux pump subunit AcrB [Saezia sanguinis]|uniref:Multidrug efflux pump subunit AcrB n=1 Tax=Saezia sanguinis TaxID=1965230 RepID=A0A433SE98_9BURK|nr:efflux RND transporter permease subunit [Saezia sanguinis]RUS67063.1 Multidrug efflux pump subunit AcrB [Saezia sanguinis]
MAKFFIDRPIFAWVVAIVIMIAGAVSITQMAIEQYPPVAPTQITVNATYPGATAQTLEESVLAVIEREMNSAKGLAYMETVSNANGSGSITLNFEPGIDPDMAQVDVQNLLSRATPRLPASVTQQGVIVRQSRSNFLMMVVVTSTNPNYRSAELNDYAARNVVDELSRLNGVGQAMQFGGERAMRIWVDPTLLKGYNLSMTDVSSAISSQNAQVSAGTVGDVPIEEGQTTFSAIVVDGQLSTEEQFKNIVLRANPDGSTVRLGDVARVELGTQSYNFSSLYNGQETAGIGIQLSSNGNALATAKLVRDKMQELSRYFPEGVEFQVPYDTTKFISTSIEKVVHTLFEAIALVFVVMFIFLQNVRYTVIPTIVVPIALLGAFAALYAMGFSINVLTMFAMVLVIGIVVDDAIIVVENVERIMSEEGLPPLQAARKAMGQISGAIIGVTVVLVSVFVPLAFFKGSTGNIYRQFSATMATAIGFSAFLALSLTPALCATMLKPVQAGHHAEKKGFFGWFNRNFTKTAKGYESILARLLQRSGLMMLVYLAITFAAGYLFLQMKTSFLPNEDQGVVIAMVQLPAGATSERTELALDQFSLYMRGRPDAELTVQGKPEMIRNMDPKNPAHCSALQAYVGDNQALFDGLVKPADRQNCDVIYALLRGKPEVADIVTVRGFSFAGQGQNAGLSFVPLIDWSDRTKPNETAQALAGQAMGELAGIRDAFIYTLSPPPIPELGIAAGFEFRLEDRGANGHEALLNARNQLLGMAAGSKILSGVRPDGLEDSPQIYLNIDRDAAQAQGVDFSMINAALSTAFGSSYVNDFLNRGRLQRVIVQADAPQRMQADQILQLTVVNSSGKVVPFSSFATVEPTTGPVQTVRFNGYPAMKIAGNAAEGYSTGDAMAEMERLAAQLPEGFAYEWTGQSREEKQAGSQAFIVYAFAILAVFLCLAALYESWSIPFSVMLVVPLGVLGVILATLLRGMENDIYFQIGLITIIGLSAKNAILIVEFAKDLQAEGKSLMQAALEAAHLRFRPILMTSLAFTFGVLPLYFASGASSASQRAIGTGVTGGMITGTVLAIIFVPVFFVVIRSIFKGDQDTSKDEKQPQAADGSQPQQTPSV